MNSKGILLLLLAVGVLSGCATIPTGPSVTVWPGPGKPFEVFQSDDAACRQWASQQVGGQPSESANKTLVSGAAIGTILGAGLGAAIGAASGQLGAGLAIGAASGAIGGQVARPMEPDGKSRGDMTMPICNVCMQRGIRSQVPCAP
jgi:hypothetical protein